MKTYSELCKLTTFEERFNYLRLDGAVGEETFGYDRYLNQAFYKSPEWRRVRDQVIIRDNGCDLGIPGYELNHRIFIHHMNPIIAQDFENHSADILDPENLICVSFETHQLLHYGSDLSIQLRKPIERKKNDTCPWKHE